ncbi:GNAT family N-acetyltransferase [Vibrio toranzoniae]|uniref:GNAT family N-acetyltransferase n=1 Tax=Vibrio toranzoniae TaxID=1194427 RepID=UPI001377B3E8|nr:GNAT family N-acetyltransferase [Vibrio toranzoniae]NAZ95989.1 GNAT family N-acetyltransferase [Vibrio toranzoniae]
MSIKGNMVTLRAIEIEDLEFIHQWANDSDIWDMLGGWHFPYSKGSSENWIKNINNNDKKNQYFAIEIKNKKIIGTINIVNIDWKNRSATYGIMLGDIQSQGKGYAKDAMLTILTFLFEELGLIRIESDILDTNIRSLKFHKNNGWVVEGEKKFADYRRGVWHSKTLIAFTIDEYSKFLKVEKK